VRDQDFPSLIGSSGCSRARAALNQRPCALFFDDALELLDGRPTNLVIGRISLAL